MRSVLIALSFAMLLGLQACQTPESLAVEVKASMEDQFKNNPDFKSFEMQVKSVVLVKESKSKFQGVATILLFDKSHNVGIEVICDGDNFIWNAKKEDWAELQQAQAQRVYQKQLEQIQAALGE